MPAVVNQPRALPPASAVRPDAIASLVLGLVAFFLPGLGIVALILGIRADWVAVRSGDTRSAGVATIGIALGTIFVLLMFGQLLFPVAGTL